MHRVAFVRSDHGEWNCLECMEVSVHARRELDMTIQFYDLVGDDANMPFSPFCWRIRMSLLHKGLTFTAVPWRFSDKSATAASGHSRVPVIKDGDQWVGDSWEIAKYLDAQYPDRPTLINGVEGQAYAQLVQALCQSLVFPAALPVALYQVYGILDEASQDYFRKSREAWLGKKLEDINAEPETGKANLAQALVPFNTMLDAHDFMGGDQPTYADYALFGVLKWGDVVSPYRPIDDASAVGQWFVRLENLYGGHAVNLPTVRQGSS